ncbi:MAG: LysR family transcriptional regulator [Lachnospiraceae bacterium]|nr:LysR family transcriptional regulator [Lachnospiraceae bacterium]
MKKAPNRYEIFLKVAEAGSISKASEALQYTQSGISHVIASLEQDMGFKLFVRTSSGVTLTDNGQRLVPLVQDIINREQILKQTVYEINHDISGRLRIGSFTSVTSLYLPEAIEAFAYKYPDVKLEVLDGNYDQVTDWLRHGRVDCAFLTEPLAKEFHFKRLMEDPLVAVMKKGHPLAEQQTVTLKELGNYPLIIATRGSDNDIRLLFEEDGVKLPSVRYALKDDCSIISFIEHDLGVGLMSELMLQANKATLERRPLNPPRSRVIGLACLSTQNSMLVNVFREYLEQIMKR